MKRSDAHTFLMVLAVAVAGGCSTQAQLTLLSEPEGAYVTEKGSGKGHGTTPVVVSYDLTGVTPSNGCYLVKGFDLRWVSGATASIDTIRLCGSKFGEYNYQFSRDPAYSGLDEDLRFAMQQRAVRGQQQVSQNSNSVAAALAAFASGYNEAQSRQNEARRQQLNCTSFRTGDFVSTNCR